MRTTIFMVVVFMIVSVIAVLTGIVLIFFPAYMSYDLVLSSFLIGAGVCVVFSGVSSFVYFNDLLKKFGRMKW